MRHAFAGGNEDSFEPRKRAEADVLPLFAPPGWPESPPAPRNEQRALPIRKATIEGDYRAWRATADGERVFHEFCKQALEEAATEPRLSAKGLWERIRRQLRIVMNNNYHALVVRDAEELLPELAGRFEKRKRKTA